MASGRCNRSPIPNPSQKGKEVEQCNSGELRFQDTHPIEKEMMVNRQENGLKGQHKLAQGKQSGALGWKANRKIVRAIKFAKEKILFRTREITICLRKMMSCNSLRGFRKLNSVRKELFALFIESSRTVFLLHPLPRLRRELSRTEPFRFVPPSTLPWAIIYWPFRPEKIKTI